MSLKVKAKEREFKVGKYAGDYRYVMLPELYSALTQSKVIREAALRSGVSEGVMKACWDAAGQVIKAWCVEGHSVALPGIGSMRFGLSAASVDDVNKVKTSLIKTRRIVFTPSTDLKQELKDTAIIITCYDRDGKEVKRVTSADDGIIEDTNGEDTTGENDGGNTSGNNSGSGNSGSQSGNGGNTNSGSNTGSETNTGGNSGSNTGSNTGGDEPIPSSGGSDHNGQSQQSTYNLTIARSGSGTSTVKDDSENVITGQRSFAPGTNLNIEIVPAEGQIPTARLNYNPIELTENDGTYTGSFQMPAQGSVLELNSGSNGESDNSGGFDLGDGD